MRELVFPPKINASVKARWQLTGDDESENGGGQKLAAYNSSNIIHKPHWIVLDRSQRVIVGFIDSSLDANFRISGSVCRVDQLGCRSLQSLAAVPGGKCMVHWASR